jgi:hypothetical protein
MIDFTSGMLVCWGKQEQSTLGEKLIMWVFVLQDCFAACFVV